MLILPGFHQLIQKILCTNSNPVGHIYKNSYIHKLLKVMPQWRRLEVHSHSINWALSTTQSHLAGWSPRGPAPHSLAVWPWVNESVSLGLHIWRRWGNSSTWCLGFLQRMWRARRWDSGTANDSSRSNGNQDPGRGVEKEESHGQGRKTSESTWNVPKILSEKCFLL